jgi:hypothetical protein
MIIEWEELSNSDTVHPGLETYRAKVPGGWLVMASVKEGIGITFYPDPEHVWDGGSLK